MGEGGFVNQTYCDMVNWQWYHDMTVYCLFMHLLCIVNKSDKMELGISVKSGSVLTSYSSLASFLKLTKKQIIYALEKLESSHDISIKNMHRQGAIITITEWNKYNGFNAINENANNAPSYENGENLSQKSNIQESINNEVTTSNENKLSQNCHINGTKQSEGDNLVTKLSDKCHNQDTDTEHITNQDEKYLSDKCPINVSIKSPKEQENRETSPTPLKENKEEENTNSKEINNNINIIKKEKFSEDEPEKKTEEKTEEKTDEGQKTNDNATPKKKPVYTISFSFEKSVFEGITDKDIELWRKAYPAIDVENEILKAACWLAANPKNAKSNYKKFLNNWFSRAQDHARPGQQLLQFPSQMSYGERKRLQAGPDVAQVPGFLGKEIDFDKDDPNNPF